MGNCQACLSSKSVHNSNEEEEEREEMIIRVVRTTDNEVFEFPGPVCVKDLLFGFQGFALFSHSSSSASAASSSLFSCRRKKQQQPKPLPPDTLLTFRHLYYLKPLAQPSLFINHPHHIRPLLPPPWPEQPPFLTQPLLHVASNYSLLPHTANDSLLSLSSPKPSITGIEEDFLSFNAPHHNASNHSADDSLARSPPENPAPDLRRHAQEGALVELAESPFAHQQSSFNEHADLITIDAGEGSVIEHAEGLSLITINTPDERPVDAPPEGLSALSSHDRALNELAEGLILLNAQGKPSSLDVPIQSPSQVIKMRKVRFSDEIVVIPSSNELANSAAPTCSPPMISTGDNIVAPNEEAIARFGKGIGQIGYNTASKEELQRPYNMSKKEMNGVVRLKVVISKKQLTELMASRAASEKQSNAIVERMLAPLLSATSSSHKSDSFHGVCGSSPSWRPSLDHIPEDHPFHELL